MQLITRPTRIDKDTSFEFETDESNWYLVSASARVKSEKQRGKGFTDDEDLRIEIDSQKFPQLNNPKRYLDSPAAFSGGDLHNNRKIVYFILYLTSGKHLISLIPDEGALVDEVEVNKLDSVSTLRLDLEQQAEEANNKPWLTFVLVNLGLRFFTIKATVAWRFPDGDDIKIIVDNKIKKNLLSLLHKNWIFSSNVLRKLFQKEMIEKAFKENLPVQTLHYLEIWADETPILHSVTLNLEEPCGKEQNREILNIKKYDSGPKGEDYNRFDEAILLAVAEWNRLFLAQKYPPSEPLDPNLVKAMIYIESAMGYYPSPEGYYPSYPDVMQVADERNPAIHTLNNDGWIDPNTGKVAGEYEWKEGKGTEGEVVNYYGEANGNTPQKSIRWGVRWLYHKAQFITNDGKRGWYLWNKAVQNYNTAGNIKYEKDVYAVYKQGTDERGQYPIRLWVVVLLAIITSLLSGVFLGGRLDHPLNNNGVVLSIKTQTDVINQIRSLMNERLQRYKTEKLYHYSELFQEPFDLCEADDRCYPDLLFPPYLSELVAGMQTNEQFAQAAGALRIVDGRNFYHGDIDNDGHAELVLVLPDYQNREYTTLFVIDQIQNWFQLHEKRVELGYFSTSNSEIGNQSPLRLADLTGDAVPEILLFVSRGRWGARLYIFNYSAGEIQKLFSIDEAYVYPEFVLTDQNRNQLLEIQVTGEEHGLIPFNFECNACPHMEVKEAYEYNSEGRKFVQIRQEYLGVPGAFYYFLNEIKDQGFNHPTFSKWSFEAKERFTYSLNQLRMQGINSLFDTLDKQPVSVKDQTEITLLLQRPLKLEDLVAREDETPDQTVKRLYYYDHSPVYEVSFQLQADHWIVSDFQEIFSDLSRRSKEPTNL